MNEVVYPYGVDSARVIQVIETQSARGSGAKEQPSRIVTEYWSLDGEKLAERDPYFLKGTDNAASKVNSASI